MLPMLDDLQKQQHPKTRPTPLRPEPSRSHRMDKWYHSLRVHYCVCACCERSHCRGLRNRQQEDMAARSELPCSRTVT
eukprot:1946264-Amphidinium_carterae.4